MTVQITIIGLRQIGASIGLALAGRKEEITRVGSDVDNAAARKAEKSGAVDKTVLNLPSAVRDADIVILALPFDEVRPTIETIAPDLKAGAVLIDTSPVKESVIAWAEERLPKPDRYFLSITPSVNPLYLHEFGEEPHADLFQNSLMLISNGMGVDESALTLAGNLVEILGAKPLFADAVEGDGLTAASHLLPDLVAAALVNTTMDQPGWREARKMAGQIYAQATRAALHDEESQAVGQMAQANAQNVQRLLEAMINELLALRDAVAEGDHQLLQERLERASARRATWQKERQQGDWDANLRKDVKLPGSGDVVGRLFGFRPKKDKK